MNTSNLLTGVGVGATLAYLLDPTAGRRRRARVRDKVVHAARRTRDGLDATGRDLANRTRGVAAAARARKRPADVDDDTLRDRVRSRLGHVCSHPRAIIVEVADSDLTLRGHILAGELSRVLAAAANIPGVRSVAHELEAHATAEHAPALQGNGRVSRSRDGTLRRNWAPATRALVIATGVAATGMWLAARR